MSSGDSAYPAVLAFASRFRTSVKLRTAKQKAQTQAAGKNSNGGNGGINSEPGARYLTCDSACYFVSRSAGNTVSNEVQPINHGRPCQPCISVTGSFLLQT
jgi:hypothetical protein